MKKQNHAAYNLETLEIMTSSQGNHLKRMVSIARYYDRKNGYPSGRWIFAHGKKALENVCAKAQKYFEKQGRKNHE